MARFDFQTHTPFASSVRVAAMTGVEVIDMMDIAPMLYRIGQDKRYSQIARFLRMDVTRVCIREVIVNAERGMSMGLKFHTLSRLP